jgi:hypothetical protein
MNPSFLEYKVTMANKLLVCKLFWHTFRWADVQWVQKVEEDVVERVVFTGVVARCLTMDALAA